MPSSLDRVVDLNADVGEGPGEGPLYSIVSSVNIACGGHAGDQDSMTEAVRRALDHGVAIGAHPSYPDRGRFGRARMSLPPHDLTATVREQIAALVRVADEAGARLTHVKPHGALYGDAAADPALARAIAEGVAPISPGLMLVGLAGSVALRVWREMGFPVCAEGFADRTYAADGRLASRREPGAVITDPAAAARQAVELARAGVCESICVHADTEGAVAIAGAVRRSLEDAGFVVASVARRTSGR